MTTTRASTRGPVPKRSNVRAGHRAVDDQPDQVRMPGAVKAPPAARWWAPRVRAWYRALVDSGQSRYFEPSDWEYARILADLLTNELRELPRATMVNAVLAGMDKLGTTEAARRRMRIEVERSDGEDGESADITPIDRYRARAGG